MFGTLGPAQQNRTALVVQSATDAFVTTFGFWYSWSGLVGLAGCRDSFMRRDSGGHGAGTPQWTSSGQWSPSNPTIDAFSPHCATYGHSEECITGTLRQTHPIQRARSKLLKNSEHSNGVNLLSFLSVQRAQGSKL